MPTYKVVLEVESDVNTERVQQLLVELLGPDVSTLADCDFWTSKVLAVAETQSSRESGQSLSE